MNVQAIVGKITESNADTLLVYLMEDGPSTNPENATKAVNEKLNGLLTELIESGEFVGKTNEVTVLYPRGALAAKRVIVVGLGKVGDFTVEVARRSVAIGMQKAWSLTAKHVATVPLGTGHGKLDVATSAQSVVEGAILGLYQYHGQKTGVKSDDSVTDLEILAYSDKELKAVRQGVSIGIAITDGVRLARDLVNLPPNICTPMYLAERAAQIAEGTALKVNVLEEQQMRALKMGALLAVAQGSQTPPCFIVMEHNSDKSDLSTVVLIGKGVTFDTGGYSLKPGDSMVGMKADMAGGAAVIGAMRTLSLLDVPLRVVGLVPAADNMVNGKAYRPQEVVTASNGKTIEIISTDAEGRLLLADALVYAKRYNPTVVIDIATLTGSCVIALGGVAAGLFSSDDDLRDTLMDAAKATQEKLWPLPLMPEYFEPIKSQTADMKNSGGRYGGAAIAAAFLRNFVDYPAWAHVDMAGMAGIEGMGGDANNPYIPNKGATGYGVRLLAEFVRRWATRK